MNPFVPLHIFWHHYTFRVPDHTGFNTLCRWGPLTARIALRIQHRSICICFMNDIGNSQRYLFCNISVTSPVLITPYAVPVHKLELLTPASFRFHLVMDSLLLVNASHCTGACGTCIPTVGIHNIQRKPDRNPALI